MTSFACFLYNLVPPSHIQSTMSNFNRCIATYNHHLNINGLNLDNVQQYLFSYNIFKNGKSMQFQKARGPYTKTPHVPKSGPKDDITH